MIKYQELPTGGGRLFMESFFCHQEVLAMHVSKNLLICGVGSFINVYSEYSDFQHLTHTEKIFYGQKIHFFRESSCGKYLFVIGGPYIAIGDLKSGGQFEITQRIKSSDWILDLQQVDNSKIVVVTAHNQAELYQLNPFRLIVRTTAKQANCLLYSATILRCKGSIYIFAGTVFGEVLVWIADFCNDTNSADIIQRIKGHKGVIFSIVVKEENNNGQITVCSTSDDRSAIVTYGSLEETENWRQSPPFYGHSSRVWKSFFNGNDIFTLGEDSFLLRWNIQGKIMTKVSLHGAAGVRSITESDNFLFTGGGDGGVFALPKRMFCQEENVENLAFEASSEKARKIVTFGVQGVALLTDSDLLYRKNDAEQVISLRHVLFQHCTDLKASSDAVLALCTKTGHIILIDTTAETWQPIVLEVEKEEGCDRLFWSKAYLLVQMHTGTMHLYTIANFAKKDCRILKVPKSKQNFATCFCRIKQCDAITLLGDRTGHLVLFRDSLELPMKRKSTHSHLGVFDLKYIIESNTVLSIGAGGVMKETLIKGNELIHLRAFSLPMESATKFLFHTKSTLIAGFHGASFIVWDSENKHEILSYKCGGGHRSYDFRIIGDHLNFFYIKKKNVFEAKFNLNFGFSIRPGFHSKVINCAEAVDGIIFSGSDDNTIKVSILNDETALDVQHTFQQHICGVRGISLVELSKDTYILIAVGGRQQLTLSQVNVRTGECREIKSHISPEAKYAPDSRYMCVDCRVMPNDFLRIVVGCSDCTLKIFSYGQEMLELETVLVYTHCFLHVKLFQNWIVSFATDGKVCFWDANQAARKQHPVHEMSLHQSGINCAVVKKWIGDDTNILATGGDDNRVSLAIFDNSCRIFSHFYTDQSHSCQVNGLILHDNLLLSSSIDQRVALHRFEGTAKLNLTWIADCLLTVADVHGLCLLSATTDQMILCVYGKGIEVVRVTHGSEVESLSVDKVETVE